jgi:hypothetical protein
LLEKKYADVQKKIRSATDSCARCGRKGHFVKDCRAKTDVSGNTLEFEESSEDEWGCEYCDRIFTTAFGCGVHEKSCKEKVVKEKRYMKQSGKGTCYRCGNTGHYSPDCYASRHVRGYYLD